MRSRGWLVTIAVLAGAAFSPCAAFADAADDLYNAGVTEYGAGHYEAAYERLSAAWKARQSVDIAGNLAQVEIKLGKRADAARHLSYALAHIPASFPEAQRKPLKAAFDELSASLCALDVTVSVRGATVFVNDNDVGLAPLDEPVFVDPGKVIVRVELDGHEADPVSIDARAGANEKVDVRMRVKGGAGHPPHEKPRTIVPSIVLLSVGGAGFVVGGALLGVNAAKNADVEEVGRGRRCPGAEAAPGCADLTNEQSTANAFGNAAIGGLVVGGISAAAGAGLLVWALTGPRQSEDERSASRPAVRVVPVGGQEGGGLWLQGSF